MHPAVVILVPVAALILGPRLWVTRVLKEHNQREYEGFHTGGQMAEELLAQYQLHTVKVEWTDIGDHYDPATKTVRLTRDKYERKTLTAITTAAHEVAHAFQDATNYGPFIWRLRLVKLAQATGLAGSVILMAAPATALLTRYRVSPVLVAAAVLAMLGTGLAAQLTALPTELDASFRRAMPLLREGYLDEQQSEDAKKILVASSLTYVASSLLAVMHIWPWMGRWGPVRLNAQSPLELSRPRTGQRRVASIEHRPVARSVQPQRRTRRRNEIDFLPALVRSVGKPIVRSWFRLCRDRQLAVVNREI